MSFEVVPDDLTAHAGRLDGLTSRLDTALSAANTVAMADDAYGLLCAFLPAIVNPMQEEGIEALRAASEGVRTTAGNVRTAAESYREVDQTNREPLQQQHRDLMRLPIPVETGAGIV